MNELTLRQPNALAFPLSADSLDAYMQALSNVPVLSEQQEQELAHEYVETENLIAAQKLVLGNLRFVVHIARGYSGYGLQLADLIQEGNIGLMKAVKRYDPTRGVRLVAFAVHWIRAEIHEFVIRNWRIVKVATTKAQRKLFFNLRKNKSSLTWLNHAEVENIAKDLGVTAKDILEMEKRLSGQDLGLYGESDDAEQQWQSPAATLQSESASPVEIIEQDQKAQAAHKVLTEGLAELDERSQQIITRRWLDEPKATLHDLADEYGVSAERIRQIEANAVRKLGKFAKALV